MKRIVLTGGGTAGHVTPNLAILPLLRQEGWEVLYIGSENGIEKKLVEAEGVPYYSIPTGKLRRYLSRQNITDMFRVVKGVSEATKLLKKLKPDLVFSKGGFVAVPVVLGAKKNKIPVIIHESDITPGLANKIAMPFAKTVCTTFPETLKYVPKEKGIHTGTPIRAALPGTVTVSSYDRGGYGYYVMIDHGNGLTTLYGHCSQLMVSVGRAVEAGTVVAMSGSTGRSTGPHLHFEVRVNGDRVNPRSYLP